MTVDITIRPDRMMCISPVTAVVESLAAQFRTNCIRVGVDERANLLMPMGLLRYVRGLVEAQGYGVRVNDTTRMATMPDMDAIKQAQGGDRRFLTVMSAHRLGVIEVGSTKELLHRFALIARLFPNNPIVFAAADRQGAESLRNAIEQRTNEQVGLIAGKASRPRARLSVATFRTLDAVTDRRRTILAVWDPDSGAHPWFSDVVGPRAFDRAFALDGATLVWHRDDMWSREAAFGNVFFGTSCSAVPRLILAPYRGPAGCTLRRGFQRKRRTVWRNRHRNRFVGRLALALLNRNWDQLGSMGIDLDDADVKRGAEIRVVVLVESVDHARQLRSLLRGWPVLSFRDEGLPDEDEVMVSTPHQGTIMTDRFAQEYRVDAAIVLRASAGTGSLYARGLLRQQPSPAHGNPLVVDIADETDRVAVRETGLRLAAYERQGIAIESVR